MKIYTKTGDAGQTSLLGGTRVSKSNPMVELVGTLDELNSIIGVARSFNLQIRNEEMAAKLQQLLFCAGADIADSVNFENPIPIDSDMKINEKDVVDLESFIDEMEDQLPQLSWFILPTGKATAAMLHNARAVCRRAERVFWSEQEYTTPFNQHVGIMLNRLSDLLFVMARYENQHSIFPEERWKV